MSSLRRIRKMKSTRLSYVIANTIDNGSNLLHFILRYFPVIDKFNGNLWPMTIPQKFSIYSDYVCISDRKDIGKFKYELPEKVSKYLLSNSEPRSEKRNLTMLLDVLHKRIFRIY